MSTLHKTPKASKVCMKMLKTEIKVVFAIFCLMIASSIKAQHIVQKGPMQVSIQVMMGDQELAIESLCEGFDPETNTPINLTIPENSAILISRNSVLTDANVLVNTRQPRFIFKSANSLNYQSEMSPGSSKTYTYIHEASADTLRISWKIAYANIELWGLYPASYFSDYLSLNIQDRLNDIPEQKRFDWNQESYIHQTDDHGLPINPQFPYAENDLFFIVDALTEDALIQLKGFHDKPQAYSEGFDLFVYEDLLPGDYEFIVKPYPDAPESKSLRYPFRIRNPWWQAWPILIGLTFSFTLIAGGVLFLLYRQRQRKLEKELRWKHQLSMAELKAIRAQLNPHFLFNALSSIQNLVDQKQNAAANNYLTKLAQLLRNVLSASEHSFHELRNELKLVELYLELEKLRHPFEYNITIHQSVNQDALTPVMLLQPFVENAVKHGIAGQKNGNIELKIQTQNDRLLIEILDTGPGLSEPNKNSSGLQLSTNRIQPLNDLYGKETKINISNRSDQSGVCVHISLPIE